MPATLDYSTSEPARAEVDALAGPAVLEFGNSWCGHCRRAQPLIAEAFAGHPAVRHIRIADASGRRLGRSFGVKLWPTLISCATAARPRAWCGRPRPTRSARRLARSIRAD